MGKLKSFSYLRFSAYIILLSPDKDYIGRFAFVILIDFSVGIEDEQGIGRMLLVQEK